MTATAPRGAELPPPGNRSASEAVRALAFIIAMYALLLGMGLVALPGSALSRRAARGWAKRYCRTVRHMLWAFCRIRCEIRGPVPDFPCIVASKHQSFLDVLMLIEALPVPRFVMKRSLLWVPVIGFFARRLGCVPIDRSAGGEAVRAMLDGVAARAEDRGQVIIFPQGTRVAPGARVAFRGGVLKLYDAFGLPIVIAAANTGWVWPRTGTRRTPGTAVLEFLETVPPGASTQGLLRHVETVMETASDRLADEAAAALRAPPGAAPRDLPAGPRPSAPGAEHRDRHLAAVAIGAEREARRRGAGPEQPLGVGGLIQPHLQELVDIGPGRLGTAAAAASDQGRGRGPAVRQLIRQPSLAQRRRVVRSLGQQSGRGRRKFLARLQRRA